MKALLCILLTLLSLPVMAQEEGKPTAEAAQPKVGLQFGYLSYSSAFNAMPQLFTVRQQMKELRQKYDEELKRAEDEFNQKYEAFLEGRKDFPRTILLKRQTELQELLERNIAFKERSLHELDSIEAAAMKPLHEQLNKAIASSAKLHKVAFVLNTDGNACPFIDPAYGIDLEDDIIISLATWGNAQVDVDEDGNDVVIDINGESPYEE
ncbi:MAG: OmpH family outer membrane protein [Prevotella sp.]|nr:OmpH family outer membrane protein [Prevotella sp.]